jgi:hypothetical protein
MVEYQNIIIRTNCMIPEEWKDLGKPEFEDQPVRIELPRTLARKMSHPEDVIREYLVTEIPRLMAEFKQDTADATLAQFADHLLDVPLKGLETSELTLLGAKDPITMTIRIPPATNALLTMASARLLASAETSQPDLYKTISADLPHSELLARARQAIISTLFVEALKGRDVEVVVNPYLPDAFKVRGDPDQFSLLRHPRGAIAPRPPLGIHLGDTPDTSGDKPRPRRG